MAVKKKTAKKKVAKKTPIKKASTTKKSTARAARRPPAITSKQSKSQIVQAIADDTGLSKKEVGAVFASLGSLIGRHMARRGSGEFTIPDTGVKIQKVRKPARKSRMGRNPATGEAIKIPAKPAHTAIKVTALKALKDKLG